MSLRINYNFQAEFTHVNLLKTERNLNTSLERLSTGYRINSAKDDAAGLFIADQLRLVAKALNQGSRNAQDGISAAQIAESSLSQIYDKLTAMYTKAEQAANDTNDPNARAALQTDIEKLRDAILKIASTAEFNGIKLLDGTFQDKVIHFGPRAGQTLSISIASALPQDLGAALVKSNNGNPLITSANTGTYTGSDPTQFNSGEDLIINGTSVVQGFADGDDLDAAKIAQNINENVKGVTATAKNEITGTVEFGTISIGSDDSATITISGPEGNATINLASGQGYDLNAMISLINGVSNNTGVFAKADSTGTKLVLYTQNGGTFNLDFSVSPGATSGNTSIDLAKFGAATSTVVDDTNTTGYIHSIGTITLESPEAITISATGGIDADLGITTGTFNITSLQAIDVTNNTSAEDALKILNGAIKKVDSLRSDLGSIQINLQAIIDNNDFAATQTSEAESRIRNVDFAKEMANFTKQQTLMQSGMAMLAQANQLPQMVLQLLR
ncbi:flagellin [Desulfurobacterium atlanticum]|uniref:Flagellin n=1 Tax=Desulfurobacterium atlanticum TaxID=240169 RepID=A0A238ZFW1_9BACT|nr:flagellin [Desulfurobacterium atlanticum]SNR82012.1 flagellin [Desulfurobacterium atlanticum]